MKLIKYIDSLGEKLSYITELICIPMVVVMTIIIIINVFFRYILRSGIPWAEEVSKYIMVWMVMLGSSIVFRRKAHISVDFFIEKLKYKQWIYVFNTFLTLIFLYTIIRSGLIYANFGKNLLSPTLRISRYWAFMAIPAGGLLMFIQTLINLIKYIYLLNNGQGNG